jgi:hypothetical protein
MTHTTTLFLLNLAVAAFALRHLASSRRRWKSSDRHSRPESAARSDGVDAIVRIARVDGRSLAEQTRIIARIAPVTDPQSVVGFSSALYPDITRLDAGQIAAARGWMNGHLNFCLGDPTLTDRSLKPLSRAIAAWEIELVTSDGDVLRCYGGPDDQVGSDLLRARRLIGFPPTKVVSQKQNAASKAVRPAQPVAAPRASTA